MDGMVIPVIYPSAYSTPLWKWDKRLLRDIMGSCTGNWINCEKGVNMAIEQNGIVNHNTGTFR